MGLLPFWTLVVGSMPVLGMVPGRSLGDPQTDPSSALAMAARTVMNASGGGKLKK